MYYWMAICKQSRGPHTEVDIPIYICQVDLEELLMQQFAPSNESIRAVKPFCVVA